MHLYLIGVWSGVILSADTKNTHVLKRDWTILLHYSSFILNSIVNLMSFGEGGGREKGQYEHLISL